MNAIQDRAKRIFLNALELAIPEERRAYVESQCDGDALLHAEVNDLLRHEHSLAGFLESPAANFADTAHLSPPAERSGTLIGPYRLLDQIGEGGFGVVFLAEQLRPVRRRVALKIIKPGMDTRQVIARFEAERQALAMMDHPNIAKVLDAGMVGPASRAGLDATDEAHGRPARLAGPTGRPYFVMELVQGVPITEYCDECNLTTRERLELFITICQAVQHAHQKGVIHRDLKPTNILVAIQDGEPAPKIIDFGVAKALDQRLTEQTLATGYAQMIGTPLYMSPEQAELSPLGADTRSDVYSLGVLLYELLTGTTPFDKDRLHSASYGELRRIIGEEDPPRPSSRLTTFAADTATTIAERRRTDPRRLFQTVRGELDWIVMKCLEKDRTRRYESASSVARDIERYLNDEPVQACPPSAGYRFRKFAHRNRVALGIATAAIATLLLLVAALAISNRLIAAERARADLQRQRAEANFRMAQQAVDRYFTRISENLLLDQPGLEPLRKELLEAALEYYQDFLAERSDDPQLQVQVVAARLRAAQIYRTLDHLEQSLIHLRHALESLEKLLAAPAEDVELRPLAEWYTGRRDRYRSTLPPANPHEFARTYRRAIELWKTLSARHPDVAGFRHGLAGFYLLQGDLQDEMGRYDESLSSFQQALRLWRDLVRQNPSAAEYQANLAHSHDYVAKRLRGMQRISEMEQHILDALEVREDLVERHPDVAEYQMELAMNYSRAARVSSVESEREKAVMMRRALDMGQRLVQRYPSVPRYRENLAILTFDFGGWLHREGRLDEALAAKRRAAELLEDLSSDPARADRYSDRLADFCRNIWLFLLSLDRQDQADEVYRRALAVRLARARRFPDSFRDQEKAAWLLVLCADDRLADPELAVELAQRAVELRPDNGNIRKTLGAAHYRAGNYQNALADFEKSLELHPGRSHVWFFLAMTHWRLGNMAEALRWNEKAVQWMEENAPHHAQLKLLRREAHQLIQPGDSESNTDISSRSDQ